jgi:hypothetical protein
MAKSNNGQDIYMNISIFKLKYFILKSSLQAYTRSISATLHKMENLLFGQASAQRLP